MLYDKDYWQNYLNSKKIPELPIKEVSIHEDRTVSEHMENFVNFNEDLNGIYSRFIKYASYHSLNEIVSARFTKDDLYQMRDGICPKNCLVALKVPFEYGGNIEFDNLYIIKRYPYFNIIKDFTNAQIYEYSKEFEGEGLKVPPVYYTPYPKGMVFLPAYLGMSGGGGNTATDRLSEIASVMALSSKENN